MPAITMVPRSSVAPATPITTPAVDTMPSLAPSTAARSQLSRVPTWSPRSSWKCCGCSSVPISMLTRSILAKWARRFNEGEAGLSRARTVAQDLVAGASARALPEVRGDQRHLADLPPRTVVRIEEPDPRGDVGRSAEAGQRDVRAGTAGRPRAHRPATAPSGRRRTAGPADRRRPASRRGVEHARPVGVREGAAAGDPHPEAARAARPRPQQVVELVERSLGQLRREGQRHVPLPGVGPAERRRLPTHGQELVEVLGDLGGRYDRDEGPHQSPRSRPISIFMISLDPAQILVTRASRQARATRYSFM